MIRPNTAHRPRIVLLDADRFVRQALAESLARDGYDVAPCATLSDAESATADGPADLFLADLDQPGVRPDDAVARIKGVAGDAAVLALTRFIHADNARVVLRAGVADVIAKPVDERTLQDAIERALRRQALQADGRPAVADPPGGLIGHDPSMRRVFETVEAVAATRTNVLILGESGTGKSMLARAVHARSTRAAKPFVEVACGSLPDTLLESELFGHVKGGFTGAVADKPGRFVAADGGTIFLDEINSAPPLMQVKLLRVLQERRLEPVGSDQTREVDVRTILASNADLAAMVAAGTFRQDLYYRVNVVTVRLPPLRERPGDIVPLADAFARRFAREAARAVIGLTPAAERRLLDHAWPGNVRELENAIERAVVLGRRPLIDVDDLPEMIGRVRPTPAADPTPESPPLPLALALEGPEKRIIEHALARHGWSRNATAAELGIDRTTLYKKMRKYGLEVATRRTLAARPGMV